MNFPLEVVAEKGKLQSMLGLTPIDRTDTHSFPNGKVTIRTNRVPTPTETGAYTLYYNTPEGYRAVCSVQKMRDYRAGYANVVYTPEIYYAFNSGSIKASQMDAFVQTLKMIEEMVSRVMRKETREQTQED